MTLEQIVVRVQSYYGFRGDLREQIIAALQETQENLETGLLGFLPWFLERRVQLEGEGDTISLPSDFLRELEDKAVWRDGSQEPLVKTDDLRQRTDDDTRRNLRYTVIGYDLVLECPLEVGEQVELRYYRKDSIEPFRPDTDIGENAWMREAGELMVGGSGLRLAGLRDDYGLELCQLAYERGVTALTRQHHARQEANRIRGMGVDNDGEVW